VSRIKEENTGKILARHYEQRQKGIKAKERYSQRFQREIKITTALELEKILESEAKTPFLKIQLHFYHNNP